MKKYSICFLCLLAVLGCLVWTYPENRASGAGRSKNTVSKEETASPDAVISARSREEGFWLQLEDGRLLLYDSSRASVLQEFTLSYYYLNPQEEERLSRGMYFETKESMYRFMESITS